MSGCPCPWPGTGVTSATGRMSPPAPRGPFKGLRVGAAAWFKLYDNLQGNDSGESLLRRPVCRL